MILFFGTRPGKTQIKTLKQVICPYCKQRGSLRASEATHYFHLFWIKIFKIAAHTIAECAHCKRTYYKGEFTEEMNKALKG
ncbi:MAG: zinc-ribbon domain-containing protein [Bacteroidota bacterium]